MQFNMRAKKMEWRVIIAWTPQQLVNESVWPVAMQLQKFAQQMNRISTPKVHGNTSECLKMLHILFINDKAIFYLLSKESFF